MLALQLTGLLLLGLLLQVSLALVLPGFVSGERKRGSYRVEPGTGRSTKLPMTGGLAFLATLAVGLLLLGRQFPSAGEMWRPLVAAAAFFAVGLVDDIRKWEGQGMPASLRLAACLLAGLVGAAAVVPWSGGDTYPWRVAGATVLLFAAAVGCDFTDGVDGLAATVGTLAVVGLALGGLAAGIWPAYAAYAVFAMATLAFFSVNLPSAWGRGSSVPRKARAYFGDSGALALGGGAAALAVWLGLGVPFIPAASLWFLSFFCSAWQAEVLTKGLYRPHGKVLLYGADWAPHTEFPLPLLAAPPHHHLELAGWDRLSIVHLFAAAAAACAVGAFLAALGGLWAWAGWFLAAVTVALLWGVLSTFRTSFLALGPRGRLALNAGFPFTLAGHPFWRTVRETGFSAAALTAEERLWLYRPMTRPDALEMLVRLLHSHGQPEASDVASLLPEAARGVRLGDLKGIDA